MNLIKTDIVPSKYDVYWAEISIVVKNATPKPVLVITEAYEKDSEDEKRLFKMLEASKLTAEQYNIIMLKTGEEIAWHQLRDALQPKAVFLFGVMPAQLGLSVSLKLNLPNKFNDCVWLPTLSLADLGKNEAARKQLWNEAMQPVFITKQFGDLQAHGNTRDCS